MIYTNHREHYGGAVAALRMSMDGEKLVIIYWCVTHRLLGWWERHGGHKGRVYGIYWPVPN
ncbi:MAG: hypothetical protein ACR2OU_20075 [Thermomicrobiales bacterium]